MRSEARPSEGDVTKSHDGEVDNLSEQEGMAM